MERLKYKTNGIMNRLKHDDPSMDLAAMFETIYANDIINQIYFTLPTDVYFPANKMFLWNRKLGRKEAFILGMNTWWWEVTRMERWLKDKWWLV